MRRWHEEKDLMFRRWKQEMRKHGYDWRNPPVGRDACHCAAGIGSMRKKRPFDCGVVQCSICHEDKFLPKARANKKRAAIEEDLSL